MTTYGFNIHHTYQDLPPIFYSLQKPLKFANPSYIKFNALLASELGLDKNALDSSKGIQFLLGNTSQLNPNLTSMAYAGHQYGQFNTLGDGRAHLLFEHKNQTALYDIQLKGSGPTVYSRGFDGRLTLRSALLEYLMSEALHALKIPTTRSLAVIKTGDFIKRMGKEDGAVLLRVSKSHLRVGTFEYAVNKKDNAALKALTDYAIKRHDSDLINTDDGYLKWFKRVIERQAKLIAKWQSVGFVHGVMNTDNMLISGETIDFGPCAFIDTYNLDTVFSSIDTLSRYAYGKQPFIGSWNLAVLGQMMIPLINETHSKPIDKIQAALKQYGDIFEAHYYKILGNKIGIHTLKENDIPFIDELLTLMETYHADYTNTWISLSEKQFPNTDLYKSEAFLSWFKQWKSRIQQEKNPLELMKKTNPQVIPRNHLVKNALDKAAYHHDFKDYNALLHVLKNPFNTNVSTYFQTPPTTDEKFITYCGT